MRLLPRLLVTALVLLLPALPAAAEEPALPDAVWPLDPQPEVASGFDPPETTWGAGHRGVDLRGSVAQQVRAAAAGTITFAGTLAGRGVVTVDHGGLRTTYEPVDAGVSMGDHVDAGDPIGRLQLPLSHCFPAACLHWGLLRGETYLDPLQLVGAGPVRLLPLDGFPSGPRVRLPVGLAQAIGGDVGVDLGRGQ